MIGKTIGHYRVLEEIGRGGMGQVFRAQDLKLGRLVALKFIKPGEADEPVTRQRFVQEARAASSLDHPNICTIHEVDQVDDGGLYIVMSYYDGEVLEQRVRQTGPVPVHTAVEIGVQVCNALSHAHKAGIVHRDIKPSNIMITRDGAVKILDFGLAKTSSGGGLTRPGGIIGTLEYMSPEQASGESVDHLTDVWSTAVVLYECLTRKSPFYRDTEAAMLNAILNEEVPPVQALRPDVPFEISDLIDRALSKNRDLRPASIDEFLAQLSPASTPGRLSDAVTVGHLSAAATLVDPGSGSPPQRAVQPSILVLPFRDMTSETGHDYFTDGLTDELITDLSVVRSLRVISSTSSMLLKGGSKGIREVAREVRVRYVLEGSVRRHGQKLRVTAKLIDAATESVVWADKYSGSLDDVFSIQEDISGKIVEALRLELSSEEREEMAASPVSDIQAYEFYLKAKAEVMSYSRSGLSRALDYLSNATERVGDNVMLLSAIGQVNWQFINAGVSTDPAHLARASECAATILEKDPDSPHGLRLLGLVRIQEGNLLEGVQHLRQALTKAPHDADTLGWLVACLGSAGLTEEAWPLVRRLLSIDPLTPLYQALPGILHMMDGEFDEAVPVLEAARGMDPDNPALGFVLGQALTMAGETTRALDILDELARTTSGSYFGSLGTAYGCALREDRAGVLEAVTPEVKKSSRGPQYAWHVAQIFALVDEKKEALDWVETAVAQGFTNHELLGELDPLLHNVRSEPRLAEIVETARSRQQQFRE